MIETAAQRAARANVTPRAASDAAAVAITTLAHAAHAELPARYHARLTRITRRALAAVRRIVP